MSNWMKYLCYAFEIITSMFVIISCIIFGGLFCLGMYSFIQDLKLIDNNLATDVIVIIIGYVFFKLALSTLKGMINEYKNKLGGNNDD